MISFQQEIRVNRKSLQFNFYGLTISTGRIFLIVCHGADEGTVFRMKENHDGRWVVGEDTPDWLRKMENRLSAVIEKSKAVPLRQ